MPFSGSSIARVGLLAMCQGGARSDLQSDRLEYKDLQSDYRITNASIHCGWIANPAERQIQPNGKSSRTVRRVRRMRYPMAKIAKNPSRHAPQAPFFC